MPHTMTDAILDAAEITEKIRPVPQQRIMDKLDEYMSRLDYPAVERHLLYWLAEAKAGHDLRGELMLRNEMVGHYRKTGEREKAHESADEALRLITLLGFEGSVSEATADVNIATACHSFGEYDRALPLFEKAKAIYERTPDLPPALLGGLYNNMGLTEAALGHYAESQALYDRAMDVMSAVPRGALERAVTCLNRADCIAAEAGMEAGESRIFALLDEASDLLDTPDLPRDGYYAYVCDHCAPSFDHYGYFLAAEDLRGRAREIYERT
ncbi:MAG: tetratricopeptide repeat protein [Clostridia bacterium]|nr:tetratricopeptide repeat protein [Clostridia bacterium]